jgi:hypothetical protein
MNTRHMFLGEHVAYTRVCIASKTDIDTVNVVIKASVAIPVKFIVSARMHAYALISNTYLKQVSCHAAARRL